MPTPEVKSLLTQLHQSFGDNAPSPQVKQLLDEMQRQADSPNPDMSDAASNLLLELEGEHPQATSIVLRIIEILDSMGI